MLQIIGWTLFVYLVVKLSHLASMPTGGGYSQTATTFGARIRAGEPMLLAFSLVFSALIMIYASWWRNRLDEREYAHAKGCYAQLGAAYRLPSMRTRLDLNLIEDVGKTYLGVAQRHGSQLGMQIDAIHRDLDQAKIATFNHYTGPTTRNSPRELAALLDDIDRCVRDDWAPHGELLNP